MKKFKEMIFNCKSVDGDESVLRFVGSDASVDRAGEIMTLTGWKIENFVKNAVFLWAHQYDKTPIGKSIRTEVTDQGLEFFIKFVPKEVDPFAEKVRLLYKDGYLNAVSVGFIPLKTNPNPDGTLSITEKELLELSAVPVPCNPNALQNAFQKGIIDAEDMKRFKAPVTVEDLEKRLSECESKIEKLIEHTQMKNETPQTQAGEQVTENSEIPDSLADNVRSIHEALLFPEDKAVGLLSDPELLQGLNELKKNS